MESVREEGSPDLFYSYSSGSVSSDADGVSDHSRSSDWWVRPAFGEQLSSSSRSSSADRATLRGPTTPNGSGTPASSDTPQAPAHLTPGAKNISVAHAALDERAEPNSLLGSYDWLAIHELLLGRGPLVQHAEPCRPPKTARSHRQIFLERPRIRRQKSISDDKWLNSGGKKGGGCFWFDESSGIRKRYVRIIPQDGSKSQVGAEYCRLTGHKRSPIEDKTAVAFIVEPEQWQRDTDKMSQPPTVQVEPRITDSLGSTAGAAKTSQEMPRGTATALPPTSLDACVEVRATRGQNKFISFLAAGKTGARANLSMEIELGAVVRNGSGIKLESRKGDFAEWHRRKAGELPFEEGDVVGFHAGEISRKTKGAAMLGIVSRSAVVEGSLPRQDERHLFDTVAHIGVVPAKVIRPPLTTGCETNACALQSGPRAGDLLVPSGRNDGTAVVVGSGARASGGDVRKIAVVLESADWKIERGSGMSQLVSSLVVSPVATQPMGTRAALQMFWRIICGLVVLAALLSLSAILLHTPHAQTPPDDHVRCPIHTQLFCSNASCIFRDAALLGLRDLQQQSSARQPQWPFCKCAYICGDKSCCNAGKIASAFRQNNLCGTVQAPPWPLHRPPTFEDLDESVKTAFIDRCISRMTEANVTTWLPSWHTDVSDSGPRRALKALTEAPCGRGPNAKQYTALANGKGALFGAAQTNDTCADYGLRPITAFEECFPAYKAVCDPSARAVNVSAPNSIFHVPCEGSFSAQLISLQTPPKPPGCFINTNVDTPFNPKFNADQASPAGVSDAFSLLCGGCTNGSVPRTPTPTPIPRSNETAAQPTRCTRSEMESDCAQRVVPQQLEILACAATAFYNGLQLGVAHWEKLNVNPHTFETPYSGVWGTTAPFVGNHSSFPAYGCIAFFQGAFAGRAFFNTWRGPAVPSTDDVGYPQLLRVF